MDEELELKIEELKKKANKIDAETYKELGDLYFEKAKLDKSDTIECFKNAAKYYEKVLQIDKNYTSVYNNLGYSYNMARDYKSANKVLKKALKINEDDYVTLTNIGYTYSKCGNDTKAIDCYKKAIKINPNYEAAYNGLGYIYNGQRNYEEVEKNLKISMNLNPNNTRTLNILGYMYVQNGKYYEAKECYKKAIKISPNYANTHNILGVLYRKLENPKKAERCFLRAIELRPDYDVPYFSLGYLYDTEKGFDRNKGFEYIKKAADMNNSYACLYMGTTYYEDEKVSPKEAERYLKIAIEYHLDEAYLRLGELYLEKDFYHKRLAKEYLNKAARRGFDVEYGLNQIKNGGKNIFVSSVANLPSNASQKDYIKFCKEFIGPYFDKFTPFAKEEIMRSIAYYIVESNLGFKNTDYSASIVFLSKAIEKELDEHLGHPLVKYVEEHGYNEGIVENKQSKKHAITNGQYTQIFKKDKDERVFDEIHLNALKEHFEEHAFGENFIDQQLTNYIINLVGEIKDFSKARNNAAHIKTIEKEKCEKWIDKMIGSGQVLQNFMSKLK